MSTRRWGATLLVGALALSLSAAMPMAQADTDSHGHGGKARTVAYFTQWGIYGRNFVVRDIVANGTAPKLTHLNYAFGFLNEQAKCISVDPWADYQKPFDATQSVNGMADQAGQPLSGNLNQLKELKAKFPKLHINISIGGWTGSKFFSDAALTPESRRAMVSSCIDMWLGG